ncbi:hypothetical protein PT974_05916 [Cladobotryum mycophilum]|uniref:Uncharacterized protein n=1 Tax=Cladobotryum mycophilum TaxID=491253 RepID=A0ABR0SL74_9HYPO
MPSLHSQIDEMDTPSDTPSASREDLSRENQTSSRPEPQEPDQRLSEQEQGQGQVQELEEEAGDGGREGGDVLAETRRCFGWNVRRFLPTACRWIKIVLSVIAYFLLVWFTMAVYAVCTAWPCIIVVSIVILFCGSTFRLYVWFAKHPETRRKVRDWFHRRFGNDVEDEVLVELATMGE